MSWRYAVFLNRQYRCVCQTIYEKTLGEILLIWLSPIRLQHLPDLGNVHLALLSAFFASILPRSDNFLYNLPPSYPDWRVQRVNYPSTTLWSFNLAFDGETFLTELSKDGVFLRKMWIIFDCVSPFLVSQDRRGCPLQNSCAQVVAVLPKRPALNWITFENPEERIVMASGLSDWALFPIYHNREQYV